MSEEEILFRPIPVSQIKNNFIRRVLIVVLFVPIVLVAWAIHAVRAVIWFLVGFVKMPIGLAKSGAEYWNMPRLDPDADKV